jgi:hypothetical protein
MRIGTDIKCALAVLGLVALPAQAELLATQGAKGTLSVQYEYSAIGKKADKYEPAEWRVMRTINLVVPMKADLPQAASALRPMDAAYAADIEKKKGNIASLHKTLAPTMADMMKIAEKCDEDEACVEKAIKEYSQTMDMATINSAKVDAAAASKMLGPRYQLWQPVSQKGTYLVDESYRAQTSDPLCMGKPKQRCSREETRKGGGDIPPPPGSRFTSAAMLEVDSEKKDVFIKLPIPLSALTYSKQVTSDFPDEKSGTSSEILPAMYGQQKSITAVIPGDLRTASGTQSFKADGAGGEGGTLVVKWQFTLQ